MYAILSHGGRQYRVSAGDRLVVDRLDAQVGSVVALEPVLLTGGDGTTALGEDVDGLRVAVTVVAHRRGEKLRIFKYKAKKRSRKMAGYRSDLTELRVEFDPGQGRGAARRPATAGHDTPARSGRRRRAAARTAKSTATVAARHKPAAAATAARRPQRGPKPSPAQGHDCPPCAGTAKPGRQPRPTAKARAPSARPKRAAAAEEQESGDGA